MLGKIRPARPLARTGVSFDGIMPSRALAFAALLALAPSATNAQCLSDPKLEATFVSLAGAKSLPVEGSCCQKDVCGLPCPAAAPVPARGYVIAVGLAIAVFCCIGFSTYFLVNGKAENFFVAGRSLSLPVIALTLAAQSIDSNALLGNVDLAYKYHFWDGAVLPIGLGLSLIINGVFSARFVHREHVLTVPDIYARYYGPVVEVVISLICCASFIALLAGNLVGMSTILGYLGGIEKPAAVFICGMVLYVYTISGGLFSVALTDVVQSVIGIIGALVCAYWFIANAPAAPPPSIGFPGYVYPDKATSDLYEGVACVNDPSAWCYNAAKWCPSADDCTADNGAYPFGDQAIFYSEMSDPHGLTPFPNAIFFNWATIFMCAPRRPSSCTRQPERTPHPFPNPRLASIRCSLGFGNLAALDFQARCMAAKTEFIATAGCLIAGCLTFFTGIPFAYLGAITRYYYGPDSIHAAFEADTCSKALGLPTCGLWLPGARAFGRAQRCASARLAPSLCSRAHARALLQRLSACRPQRLPAPADQPGARLHRRLDAHHDRRRVHVHLGRLDPRALDGALAQRGAQAADRHLREEFALGQPPRRPARHADRVPRRDLHRPDGLLARRRVRHHARRLDRATARLLLHDKAVAVRRALLRRRRLADARDPRVRAAKGRLPHPAVAGRRVPRLRRAGRRPLPGLL